ncbi:MAG TPA: hypothetical protein VFE47_22025 [Tepidisphaeraceae bacterium]|nr:hypothetical protein [Tepidisphaeraceae bacterium]
MTIKNMFHLRACLAPLIAACLAPATLRAADASPGVVSHVNLTTDKIEDVSSLEAWKKSFIKPGMTDQQKAIAVWETVVKFRHQDIPPNEYLANEANVHDPIKCFNVYGYGMCCCASANIEALARYAGLDARGWGITGHSVPEINVNGHWCMFDASLINFFQKPDGTIAGVEEINKSISDWYASHPEYRNNNDKLVKFMRGDGWKHGPDVLTFGRYDENGWLPAATHGWYSSMSEFGSAKNNFVYEYGAAVGYELNIQLRPGETLIRNWSNKGLHVNMLDDGAPAPGCINMKNGTDQLRYAPSFGDIAPGRIGNGILAYDLPLESGAFRGGMLVADNLQTKSQAITAPHTAPISVPAAVFVKDATKPAELTFRMPSSYVYLGGELTFSPVIGTGGSVVVSFSDNNGLDWKEIGHVTTTGPQKIDLKPLVFRRYDYRLKFILSGAGTGLDAVKVTHDIQHSQRPLPALVQGDNMLHFTAGPQEGTITVQGAINPPVAGKNLLYSDFHPTLQGVDPKMLVMKAGNASVTFPIATPGDITRLRLGVEYRARDPKDGWMVEASFDGGKSWKPMGDLAGPTGIGHSSYLVLSDVPAASRSAQVRFTGRQRNTTMLMDVRLDADYAEPHGGFSPVKITYAWEENGQIKQDIHIAQKTEESYTIHCAEKPVMKSMTMALE